MGRDVMERKRPWWACGLRKARGPRVGLGTEVPRGLLLIDDYEFIRIGVRTMCARLHGRPVEWHEAARCRTASGSSAATGPSMRCCWISI